MGRLPTGSAARLLVIDPTHPDNLYASDGDTVYRSGDAGFTWQPSSEGLPETSVAALAVDPRQPTRLFAATTAGALYVSADGALSWQPASGATTGAEG